MLNINPPPSLMGDEQAQLRQVYRYLFQLSEQLNVAMGDTQQQIQQTQSGAPITKTTIIQGGGGSGGGITDGELNAALDEQYNALNALIIKTADTVRAEMDAIVTQLDSKYVAESEWGEYRQSVSTEIVQTAQNTIENYQYGSETLNIPEMAADFDAYRVEAQGYIKRGIIGRESDGTPIFGLAIAQELSSVTVTLDDGSVHEEFNKNVNMATYTADRLSFWINGTEVAYMSSGELYVTRAIILNAIKLGGWEIVVDGKDEMTIKSEIGAALNLQANETIKMLIGTNDDINRWFTFDDNGFTVQKKGIRWRTVTDELGYHIWADDEPSPAGSFQGDGLQTTGVSMGDITCKRTATGGWVWTDAAQGGE